MQGSNHRLNLVLAILSTIFCCLPLGIIAIVFAAIAMSRNSSGDYYGAESAAQTARTLNWVFFGIGFAGIATYLLLFWLGVASFLW